MIPESFASRYPNLAAALIEMRTTGPDASWSSGMIDPGVAGDLTNSNRDGGSLLEILRGLFQAPIQPNDGFMRFSMAAHQFLGVSNDAHVFMGRLWADAIPMWSSPERAEFLSMLVQDPQDAFHALSFGVEMFRRIQFTADEAFPWIAEAHRIAGNDHFQGGFWGCIEAFCATSTKEAITVLERWLDSNPKGPSLRIIRNMIGWLRLAAPAQASDAARFAAIEDRVRSGGHSAWRGLYIQSWAYARPDLVLNEQRALDMRDRYVHPGSEEEIAWCYLLNSIIQVDKGSWVWAQRELHILSRPGLGEEAKYWAVTASLHCFVSSVKNEAVVAENWLAVLRGHLPISPGSLGTWEQVYAALRTLVLEDVGMTREFIRVLAQHSGEAWLKVARERQFLGFFQLLRQKGLHTSVAEDLCFQAEGAARHMGLVVLAECGVEAIGLSAVTAATDTQIELLLLEAQRRLLDNAALARLHACLAVRVDDIGGDLAERFHAECALQCLNTHQYRTVLAASASNHEYLPDIAADAADRLAEIAKASSSPALQMEVPGMARAQRLHDRKVIREVAKAVKDNSVVLSTMPTLSLLYGGREFRTFFGNRPLSEPSTMHSSSSSVEVPRLEFVDPEGMDLRRRAAENRIAKLNAQAGVDTAQ
ncbi:MAG: hypothetical protein ABSG41_19525 [Bryobacteraceae bacterium]|jgi:hypothetical protein